MTLVGPQGYPDWVRAPQQALSPIVNGAAINLTPALALGPFYTGNAGCLVVSALTTAGGAFAVLEFEFTDDQAGTVVTGVNYAICSDVSIVTDAVPVLGNFVTVRTVAPIVGTIALTVTPLCAAIPGVRCVPNGQLAAVNGHVVLAGADFVLTAGPICACEAVFAASTNLANFYLLVEARTNAGIWQVCGFSDGGAALLFDQVLAELPRAPARVTYHNRAGGPATVNLSFVARML